MNTENEECGKSINRYLSPLDVWAISFGCLVGWGSFVMPSTTFLPTAGPLGTLIALLVSTIIMLVIGTNIIYLMQRNTGKGGLYSYTKEAFGREHAFLSSWFLCLSYLNIVFLNGTALFLLLRVLLSESVYKGAYYTLFGYRIYFVEFLASVFVLSVVGLLFVVAKYTLQKINTILSVTMLTGFVCLAFICLPQAISSGVWKDLGINEFKIGYSIFSIVLISPWAFAGFEVISFDTEYFKFPITKSKKIIFISVIAGTFAYIIMNYLAVVSVPDNFKTWQEYIANVGKQKMITNLSALPTFYSAKNILGNLGLFIVSITSLAAILTGVIGGYRACAHVLGIMAEDSILFEKFAKAKYSIIFVMIISVILSLFGRNALNWFVDLASLGVIVAYGYSSAAAYKFAKFDNKKYIRITGISGLIISVIFAAIQVIPNLTAFDTMESESFLFLSIWCLLGFLFYWRTVIKVNIVSIKGYSTSGVVLFSILLYSAILWISKKLMMCDSLESAHDYAIKGGIVVLFIIFTGLAIMLYIQHLTGKNFTKTETDKIRAIEGSLAKSRFLFNMSHDIRTPMNAIIGYTNLAMKESEPEKIHNFLGKILGSSQHLLALINDILEMSRIENGKLEIELIPTDLKKAFYEMQDLFSEQMKLKNIKYEVKTDQLKNQYVLCDKKNLNRVLLNLIGNSYKFTKEGGNISLTINEKNSDESDYGVYEIRIKDNGIGMSKEFADVMFNAFERDRTQTVSGIEGTGLGLSITKSIVEHMGGEINAVTELGAGTEFIINLKFKLVDEKDIVKEEKIDEVQHVAIDFTKIRLLLVEDNMINMEIANMILTQAGFMVETASNGEIAVEKVSKSEPGYYDLVLMDIQMPIMDGFKATRRIRSLENKDLANIAIIAMTANSFKEDIQLAKEAGMQGHIAKPIDVKTMMEMITSVLSDTIKK